MCKAILHMLKKKLYTLSIIGLLCCLALPSKGQDESEEEDLEEEISTQTADFHRLSIKKPYLIGDGITFASGIGQLKISPTLQTLFAASSDYDNISKLQNSFSIPRARISFFGNVFDKKLNLVARINLPSNNQSATTGERSFNSTLQEAYLEYRPNVIHAINMGLRADYIDSRETRFQGENLGFTDRSEVSAAFDAIFNYGLRYKGNYRLGGQLVKTYASVTSGDSRSGLQKNYGGFKYGIRVDYLPFGKFTSGGEFYMDDLAVERKPKLVIGGVFSFNDGITSAMGTNGGRWLYANDKGKIILPDYTKWVADYLFKYGGFYSLGSYVASSTSIPNGIAGEFRLNGTFNKYNQTQTAQQTDSLVRSRLNVGTGFNVQAGYILPSSIAIGARFTTLKAHVNSATFADYNRFYDLIVTKYIFNHNLKIQAQIGFNALGKPLQKEDSKGNYHAQLMATIQL